MIYYQTNKNCKYSKDEGYVAVITPSRKIIPLSSQMIDFLLYAAHTRTLDDLIAHCSQIMSGIDAKAMVQHLLREQVLIKAPPITWNGSAYGSERLGQDEIDAVVQTLRTKKLCRNNYVSLSELNSIISSPCVQLEKTLRNFLHSRHVIALNSGTSALECALQAIDIRPGDEVIVPSYTYIGTASAIMSVGGTPVLCEIDHNIGIDCDDIVNKISDKTKAILCVHLRGYAIDMSRIMQIAHRFHLRVIEDCAQSIGVLCNGRAVGTWGDIGCFSFHEHKLVSSGEGGAVCTNDKALYERMKLLSDASRTFSYPEMLPGMPGHNHRMSELHAAICNVQMQKLPNVARKLRQLYCIIKNECSANEKATIIPVHPGDIPQSMYLQCADTQTADEMISYLNAWGISAARLYYSGEINHNTYMCWPYVLENAGYIEKWDIDNKKMEYLFPKTIEFLSRTVEISIGYNNTEECAKKVGKQIQTFLNGTFSIC